MKEKRIIKFRVWLPSMDEMFQPTNKQMSIFNDGSFDIEGLPCEGGILMQFTGLKDKNGKDIYEGDGCKMMVEKNFPPDPVTGEEDGVHKSLTGEVISIPSKGTCIKNPRFECFNSGDMGLQKGYYQISAYRTEVIGNIYEQPELLTN